MRIFKALLILVMVSVVAVAASVAYITQVLDPNDLKPTLVDTAKKQQIALQLNGNIAWTFWPWFGITVENVQARSTNWAFEADQLEGSLSILSALSNTVVIDELTAISPKVRFDLSNINAKESDAETGNETTGRTILIRQLAIRDGEITGLHPGLTLSRFNFSVDSLSPATASNLNLSTYIEFNEQQLPLEVDAEIIPTATFDGLTVRNVTLKSRELTLDYSGYLSGATSGQFSGEGQLSVAELSIRQWLRAGNFPVPETNELDRFNRFTLETGLKVSNDLLSLRPFTLGLDETSIDGRIDINLNPLNLDLELLADQLNLDSYLANSSARDAQSSSPPPLLPGTYKLDIGSLTIRQREFTEVGVDLGIGADEITLGRLDATLFGGELRAAGTHLIAPQITNITGTVNGLQLSQFQFSKPLDTLSGSLQSTFDLRAAGRTPDEMMASVSGPARVKIENAFLGPLNVSDAICQTIAATSNLSADTADTLAIKADFQEGIAVIESMDATVANLVIQGKGRISLVSTASNIQGSIQVPTDGAIGSCAAPEILRGVSLPLSCRGQLRNESLQCSLDEKALNQIIAKAAERELRKQADEKLKAAEQKLKSSVEDALKKKLDNQGSELLKNLLNR
jgi:AsmA protein